MTADRFVSYARNGEDVVLFRALPEVRDGRFVEVVEDGVHPHSNQYPSAMRAFVERGWTGESMTTADLNDPTAMGPLGIAGGIHVLMIAADLPIRREGPLIGHVDLNQLRPWVVVIGVAPSGRAELDDLTRTLDRSGYRFCQFDGVSVYFVAAEKQDSLGWALSYPACSRDRYVPASVLGRLEAAREALKLAREAEAKALQSAILWRERAVGSWADGSTRDSADPADVRELRGLANRLATELRQTRETVSWRVTAPLRAVRRLAMRKGSP